MGSFTISHEDAEAPKKDLETLRTMLTKHRMEVLKVGPPSPVPLNIVLKSAADQVVAGIMAKTFWGALNIDVLVSSESLRGEGWGSALLQKAESEAFKRGCHIVYLSTINARSVDFYKKHNYTLTCTIPNVPTGHSSFELHKTLTNEAKDNLAAMIQKSAGKIFMSPTIDPAISAKEQGVLKSMLLRDMTDQAGALVVKPLNVMLRDEQGRMLAGLSGHTFWDALNVDWFFVHPQLRGKGIGTSLLRKAEAVARERQCHTALANTYSPRALDFFLKYGYELKGKIQDFPRGHSCCWLVHSLQVPAVHEQS